MKITFVYLDRVSYYKSWAGQLHFGLASLSAVLKRGGHETSLIHITGEIDRSWFINQIKEGSPDLLAFTVMSPTFSKVAKLARWAKEENPDIPTICGGIHATVNSEATIDQDGFDMICRGEGETALLKLCDALAAKQDITGIANLWVKQNKNIIRNDIGPLIPDLDDLPFIDRQLFDFANLHFEKLEKEGCILASRGCPYHCSYCSNHSQRRMYKGKGKFVRFQSVDAVLAEINQLLKNFPFIEKLIFLDDILFMDKNWMREFVPKYKAQISLPYTCNMRLNLVDEETIAALKESGCDSIRVGLESGNAEIRNSVLDRSLTDETMNKGFQLLRNAGMKILTFNMVGIPGETSAQVLDTIKYNARINPNRFQISICYPFPGTKLYERAKQAGMLTDKNVSDFMGGTILKHDKMTEAQILMFYNHSNRFMKLYRIIKRLPNFLIAPVERLTDRALSSRTTPFFVGIVSQPVSWIRRTWSNLISGQRLKRA